MSGVQHIQVADDEAEQRLDRWFRRRWPHVSQGRVEKMCRKGEIRVGGARVRASTRVAPGDVVRIPPLPDPAETSTDQASSSAMDQDILAEANALANERVIYRDQHLLVLNKPPGLAVQGGSKQHKHLGAMLGSFRFDRPDTPRLVHRLDRDTSGLLVLARTAAAASILGGVFRSRSVEKIYVAAVAGRPEPQSGTIRYGLVKQGGRGAERMEIVHPDDVEGTEGARHATTHYRVLDQAAGRVAAVALKPVTGRTHQLRAHMAALGSPIAGDGKYGGRHQDNPGSGWGAGLGGALSRKLHLHAAELAFSHPITNERLYFTAPLPEHMKRTWDLMGWSEHTKAADLFKSAEWT